MARHLEDYKGRYIGKGSITVHWTQADMQHLNLTLLRHRYQ